MEQTEISQRTEEFVISRTLKAPRNLVWKMWSDPEHIARWFGPKGSMSRYSRMDFREGGNYHYCLVPEKGPEVWGKAVYREIREPESLVFVTSFSDKDGAHTRHPLIPNWPLELLTTVELKEVPEGTKVTVHWLPIHASDEECYVFDSNRESMTEGWNGSLDRLQEYLAAVQREENLAA